jgi:hypothetical protein
LTLLAILSGGLSETAAAWQLAVWGIGLSAALLRRLFLKTPCGSFCLPASLIVGGTVLAFALLALSPTNQARLLDHPDPPNMLELARMSVHHTYLFLHGTAKHHMLPTLAVFLFAAILSAGWGARGSEGSPSNWTTLLARLAILGMGAAFLIACSMSASAYVFSSYPVGRSLVIAQFTLIVGLLGAGAVLGRFLVARLPRGRMPVLLVSAPLLILALTCSYSSVATPGILMDRAKFQKWASLWDDRDREIRSARQSGLFELQVMQLDHLIPDVGELSPDPNTWYNNCAEDLYDVDAISANLPGWDPSPGPN